MKRSKVKKLRRVTPIETFMSQKVSEYKDHPSIRNREPEEVLIATRFKGGHVHVFHPDNEDVAMDMIQESAEVFSMGKLQCELKEVENKQEDKDILPKRIVFHNRQAIGDILMISGLVPVIMSTFITQTPSFKS